MKLTNRVLASAAAVAAFTFCVPARAQSLTITAPGYAGYDLFGASPGYVVAGVAVEANGSRIWYVESDAAFGGSLPTKLWSRTFNGVSAGPATLVHDFQAPLFGSFLTLQSGTLYFGENTSGGIFGINQLTNAVDPLGTIPGNYDATLFGGGALLVSHYSGGGNKLSRFTLQPDGGGGSMLSAPDLILDTGTEFSGPLELVSSQMIYGSDSSGLYRYFLTEVAAAIGPGQLALDAPHRFLNIGPNSYLAPAGGTLFWRDSFASSELQRIDSTNGNLDVIGTATGTLGQLDSSSDLALVAVVTQYGVNTTSHVFAVVPEPSGLFAAVAGLGLVFRRHKR